MVTIRCGDTMLEQGFWTDADPRGADQVKGLTEERSLSQLSQIRYKPNARGQIVIESKDELLRRGVKSPDRADSVMLAFAVHRDPIEVIRESMLCASSDTSTPLPVRLRHCTTGKIIRP